MCGEVVEQRVHVIELRAVDQAAPAALLRHQLRMQQLFQVKRKRRRRHTQRGRQGPRRQPLRRRTHQSAKHPQPHGLGQSGQSGDGGFFFHISMVVEINDGSGAVGSCVYRVGLWEAQGRMKAQRQCVGCFGGVFEEERMKDEAGEG